MGRPVVPTNLADIAELSELETLRRTLSTYAADQLALGGEVPVAEAAWASQVGVSIDADIDRRNAESAFADGILEKVGTAIDTKLDAFADKLAGQFAAGGTAVAEKTDAEKTAPAEGTEAEKAEGATAEATTVEAAAEPAAAEVVEGAAGDAASGAAAGAAVEGGSGAAEPTAAELAANDANLIPAQAKGPQAPGKLRVMQDLKDFAKGQEIGSMAELAEVLHQTASRLGNGQSNTAVSIELDHSKMVHLNGDNEEADFAKLLAFGNSEVTDELVASGGWGAHSEVRYDFFGIEDVQGMWTAPTVGVDRGGVKWPVSPSIQDALPSGNTGIWLWTEANDITAASNSYPIDDPDTNLYKPHYKIPIPSMTEKRLDLHGVILDNGNLVARAWPEAVARFIALTMAANAHTINSRRLTALASAGTAVDLTTALAGIAIENALVSAWALKGATYRGKYRMADDAILECVLPSWVPRAIAAAIGRRQFNNDLTFNAAKLTALAAAQNIRLQFVQDWQMLSATATAFTTPFSMLMYAPGTFVIGSGPKIDLGVVRDSFLNNTNDFTAVWTEQALSLMEVGHESLTISLPGIYTGVSKIAS